MAFIKYNELEVYKLAYSLAIEVHKASIKLPKYEHFGGVGDQFRRSSKSICANIAEGLTKMTSLVEENRFLRIARGSAEECRVWTQFWLDLDYITPDVAAKWQDEYERVGKMLFKLIEKREAKT